MQTIVVVQILSGVDTFLNLLSAVLVIYALMTWFMRPDNPVYIFLARIAGTVVAPFRPIANKLIGLGFRIDVSVFLALAAIQILRSLLNELAWRVWF